MKRLIDRGVGIRAPDFIISILAQFKSGWVRPWEVSSAVDFERPHGKDVLSKASVAIYPFLTITSSAAYLYGYGEIVVK